MLRSLFAGVSGLANHQVKLDVIGNNIANINTVGFKASRVTFREMLTQTIRGASRPVAGGSGGTNPQQIGLGSAIGSIDTNFSQGNMQITGLMTDLAIEGEGFFVLSDGYTQYYTRGGALTMDGEGHLVNPSNGYKLQGIPADENGLIEHGRGITDIVLPTSMVVPARATSTVQLSGNLNADSDALATITRSEALLATAAGSDAIMSLYGEGGTRIGLREGDIIRINASVGGTAIAEQTVTVAAGTSLQSIANTLQAALRTRDAAASVTVSATGALQVTAGAMDIDSVTLQVNGNQVFNNAFKIDTPIAIGASATTNDSLRAPASESDLLSTLFDYEGRSIDLIDGQNIMINGDLGGLAIQPRYLAYSAAATTVGDLLDQINQAFSINFGDTALDEQGRILVNGDAGSSASIANIDVSQVSQSPIFNSSLFFTDIQQARDAGSYGVTTLVYDSLGGVHNLTTTFTKVSGENTWNWEVTVDGLSQIMEGSSGTVQFTSDGRLASFAYNGGSGRLLIDPQNGAELMSIILDPGTIGSVDGLIQYTRAFSVRSKDLDGQTMGSLETISIDRNGVINGQFSNGVNRDLAQIAMADFNNASGLMRSGENMFMTSPNSGAPVTVFAGTNARGQISPGELEMSNVDLAGEFTEMIIAQRGFQANARTIAVGDQMLTELVNLKK